MLCSVFVNDERVLYLNLQTSLVLNEQWSDLKLLCIFYSVFGVVNNWPSVCNWPTATSLFLFFLSQVTSSNSELRLGLTRGGHNFCNVNLLITKLTFS